MPDDINTKIERSSLGTHAAKAARASVSGDQVRRVLERIKEIELEKSMPHLTPSRDTLAEALHTDAPLTLDQAGDAVDALIASGAIIDAATLTNNETIRIVSAQDHALHAGEAAVGGPDDDWTETVEQVLRALVTTLAVRRRDA